MGQHPILLVSLAWALALTGCGIIGDRGASSGPPAFATETHDIPRVADDHRAQMDPAVVEAIDRAIGEVEADPSRAEGWLHLGMVYQANELPDLAMAGYRAALEHDADLAEAWYHLGNLAAERGDSQAARDALVRVTDLESERAFVWWRRGLVELEAGRWEDSRSSFETAIQLDPRAQAAWVGRGRAALQARQPELALAHFDEAMQISSENRAYIMQLRSRALQALGRGTDAEAALAEAGQPSLPRWSGDPWQQDVEAQRRGLVPSLEAALDRIARGEIDAAIADFEVLRRDYPGRPEVLLDLGIAYGMTGRYEDSLQALAEALEADPEDARAHEQSARALAGMALETKEDARAEMLARASAHVDRAIQAAPERAEAYALRADVQRMQGDLDAAASDYAEAGRRAGQPHRWSLIAADMYLRAGDGASAIELLEGMTSALPEHADAWRLLGAARADLGRREDARMALERAVSLSPDDEVATRLLERLLEESADAETSTP